MKQGVSPAVAAIVIIIVIVVVVAIGFFALRGKDGGSSDAPTPGEAEMKASMEKAMQTKGNTGPSDPTAGKSGG